MYMSIQEIPRECRRDAIKWFIETYTKESYTGVSDNLVDTAFIIYCSNHRWFWDTSEISYNPYKGDRVYYTGCYTIGELL